MYVYIYTVYILHHPPSVAKTQGGFAIKNKTPLYIIYVYSAATLRFWDRVPKSTHKHRIFRKSLW